MYFMWSLTPGLYWSKHPKLLETCFWFTLVSAVHCVKCARTRDFSGPYFSVEGQNLGKIRVRKNSLSSICFEVLFLAICMSGLVEIYSSILQIWKSTYNFLSFQLFLLQETQSIENSQNFTQVGAHIKNTLEGDFP